MSRTPNLYFDSMMDSPHAVARRIAQHVIGHADDAPGIGPVVGHRIPAPPAPPAGPVPLWNVPFGQLFVIDTRPDVLLARVRDEFPQDTVAMLPVVVVGDNSGHNAELGRVFGLEPRHTVRLVEVVVPLKARVI